MRDYNLTVEFDKRDVLDVEIYEMYEDPIFRSLHAALGTGPNGYEQLAVTVEASGMAAAVVTTLDRVAELTKWSVRMVEVMTTRDSEHLWAIDDMSFLAEPKPAWVHRVVDRLRAHC